MIMMAPVNNLKVWFEITIVTMVVYIIYYTLPWNCDKYVHNDERECINVCYYYLMLPLLPRSAITD